MQQLNKEQIERLYDVFDFAEHEEVISAEYSVIEGEGIHLSIRLCDHHDDDIEWDYLPNSANTAENRERLYYILTGIRLSDLIPAQGWDVYTHLYEYEEVKVIALVHDAIKADGTIDANWEDIMRVGHYIWRDYCDRLKDWDANKTGDAPWALQSREEEGYVQAYLARTLDYYIEKYKNCFTRG